MSKEEIALKMTELYLQHKSDTTTYVTMNKIIEYYHYFLDRQDMKGDETRRAFWGD